jgi:hypothetical protein
VEQVMEVQQLSKKISDQAPKISARWEKIWVHYGVNHHFYGIRTWDFMGYFLGCLARDIYHWLVMYVFFGWWSPMTNADQSLQEGWIQTHQPG